MRLRNEGRIQAAPILPGAAQEVSAELQSWTSVQSFTHWKLGDSTVVDGAEFHVGDRELGHIHMDGGIHLLLTKPLRNALLERGLANPFPWGREWVEAPVRSQADAEHAVWLFRIGYDRLQLSEGAELFARISARAVSRPDRLSYK